MTLVPLNQCLPRFSPWLSTPPTEAAPLPALGLSCAPAAAATPQSSLFPEDPMFPLSLCLCPAGSFARNACLCPFLYSAPIRLPLKLCLCAVPSLGSSGKASLHHLGLWCRFLYLVLPLLRASWGWAKSIHLQRLAGWMLSTWHLRRSALRSVLTWAPTAIPRNEASSGFISLWDCVFLTLPTSPAGLPTHTLSPFLATLTCSWFDQLSGLGEFASAVVSAPVPGLLSWPAAAPDTPHSGIPGWPRRAFTAHFSIRNDLLMSWRLYYLSASTDLCARGGRTHVYSALCYLSTHCTERAWSTS